MRVARSSNKAFQSVGIAAGLLVAVVFVLFAGTNKSALAANPATINFQGKVVNSDGTNVTNGSYTFIFRLYDIASPTTTTTCAANTNCWWEETDTITVTNGVFQVELGATCALSSVCNSGHAGINFNTNNALYLTMKFNSDAAGFMSPAVHLTTTPYAFNSDQLGGLTSSQFLQLAPASAQVESSNTLSSIFVNKTGTGGNILELQKAATDVAVVGNTGALTLQNSVDSLVALNVLGRTSGLSVFDVDTTNGRVGIGTATPAYTVDINGSARATTSLLTSLLDTATAVPLTIGTTATSILLNQNTVMKGATNIAAAFQVQNTTGAPIFLVDTTSTMANGNQLNYLTYPGFEVGSFTNAAAGWAAVAPASLTQNNNRLNVYHGVSSAQITCASACTGQGLTTTSFVSAPSSGTYIVSFYAKVSSGTMAGNLFQVATAGGAATCNPSAATVINALGFQRLFCSVSPAATVTGFTITQTDATARTIYVDAVQLQSNLFNGSVVVAPTPYQMGGIQLRGVIENPLTILPEGDSTTVLQVSNAAGTLSELQVDTLNSTVYAGATGSAVIASTLHLADTTGNAAQVVSIGSTINANSTTTIQGGTGGSALSIQTGASGTINMGTTAQSQTIQIGTIATNTGNTQAISIGNTNVAGTTNVTIGAGASATAGTTLLQGRTAVNITSAGASTWQTTAGLLTITGAAGATITGNTGVLTVGNVGLTGLGYNLLGPTYTNATGGITIGTADANITLLDLDQSTTTSAETAANCTTAINPGGIYYATGANGNAGTQGIRGCINGKFQDVISEDQLGVLLLGVVPDSGLNPGDMSNTNTGPCKTSWASATTVSVAPCTAYSGGRKVVLTTATTITMPAMTTSQYVHICFTNGGISGAPVSLTVSAAGFEVSNIPTFSATAPILCIADVKNSTTVANTIGFIYDTRVFTNTIKQFVTEGTASAFAPGEIVIISGSNGITFTGGAAAAGIRGVIAVGNAFAGIGNGLIISTSGPAFVKATGTINVGQAAQTSATTGYIQSAASLGGYKDLGQIIDSVSGTCVSAATCQFSTLVDLGVH